MGTAFRGNIAETFADFLEHLQEMEGQDGGNSDQKLRKVSAGEGNIGDHPPPFLAIRVSKAEISGSVDGDKTWKIDIRFRVVSEISSVEDTQTEILHRIGQIEDQIDSWDKPEGVTGMESGVWSAAPTAGAEGGNFTIAEAVKSYTVVVARGEN